MNPPSGGGGGPPAPQPMPPIDPFVRPRGLSIRVPQNLVPLDMLADLLKFHGMRDDDPSRHMERYIEQMIIALITNQGYWLVWFPTMLGGEAYEWCRDHDKGHFMTWDQLLREFLTKYRSEVDQSTALRTLAVMRQGRDEIITAYIRRFDSVCSRYVGIMLNEVTLRQFFIQGFLKSRTVQNILERNPVTLADAKTAVREVEQLEKDYERLWRRNDDLIPQFVLIRPRVIGGATVGQEEQVPHVPVDTGPMPLAGWTPEPLLALAAPRTDPQIEEIEKKLGASQEGFQDAMMKQMQSLTDQLALVIRSQQPGPPLQVELGRHATRKWCIQCKQPGHTSQYRQNRQNQNQRNNGGT